MDKLTADQLFLIAILGLIVTPISTLFVTIAGHLFQWNMSAEQRRRDKEDRAEVARLAKETHTAVVDVGVKADLAYKEANFANLKIQAVQDALSSTLNIPTVPITASTGADKSEPPK